MPQEPTVLSSKADAMIEPAYRGQKLSDILRAFNTLVNHHDGDMNKAWTTIVFTNMRDLIRKVEGLERTGKLTSDNLYIPFCVD